MVMSNLNLRLKLIGTFHLTDLSSIGNFSSDISLKWKSNFALLPEGKEIPVQVVS